MKEIFYEIINEANVGKILIDNDPFPIGFNTIIIEDNQIKFKNENENFPTLLIKNQNEFFLLLEEYIKIVINSNNKFPNFISDVQKNRIKLIISYLFANATTEDFLNPTNLIKRNINFFNDNTFDFLNDTIKIDLINIFKNSSLNIQNKKQSIFMETPNKISFSLIDNNNNQLQYDLPEISYGIVENNGQKECYIYSIINPKDKAKQNDEQIKYSKKIKRELYKINNGILDLESIEYINYKNQNNEYYPENISDVSPSAVLSLTIFISLLEKENIKIIKAIPYLPVRYLSREIIAIENNNKEIRKRNEQSCLFSYESRKKRFQNHWSWLCQQ